MRILIQRVSRASVTIVGEQVAAIGAGLLLLVGFGRTNASPDLQAIAGKISTLRVFPDAHGRFNYSLLDIKGGALLVPQFTLYADTSRGRRPDFAGAMPPAAAETLFDEFVNIMSKTGVPQIETGRFGADMQVELVNDGPVTIMLD